MCVWITLQVAGKNGKGKADRKSLGACQEHIHLREGKGEQP